MKLFWNRIVGARAEPASPAGAPRLSRGRFPRAIYAVGDVHGRLDLLKGIEERIVAHAGEVDRDVWVVLLGDLVDRGPASAQVLDHVLSPHPSGFRRLCLSGNHEEAMLAALEDPETFQWWCRLGGTETLASYGVSASQLDPHPRHWETNKAMLEAYVPRAHREFLAGLPVLIQVPGYVLVHAGLRMGVPLAEQTDHDLRWHDEYPPELGAFFGATVVHGHRIVPEVQITPGRIALDTGAFSTGRLSGVCIRADSDPIVIEQTG